MDPPLGWSSLLLLWLSVVGEVTRFGHNSATVCILIHRRVSAELWKSSPNSSFTWNQNHCRSSILDVNRTSQGRFWSQIAMLGTRFHVRDAFLIQEFASKSWHVEWRKWPKQDHRKFADYKNRSISLLPPNPDEIVVFLSRRRRPVCKRFACLVLTAQYKPQHSECIQSQWLAVHLNRPVKGQRLDNLAVFSVPWRFCNCYGFFVVFEILNFRQINSTQLNPSSSLYYY